MRGTRYPQPASSLAIGELLGVRVGQWNKFDRAYQKFPGGGPAVPFRGFEKMEGCQIFTKGVCVLFFVKFLHTLFRSPSTESCSCCPFVCVVPFAWCGVGGSDDFMSSMWYDAIFMTHQDDLYVSASSCSSSMNAIMTYRFPRVTARAP